jgi:HAMP domain-containing protein
VEGKLGGQAKTKEIGGVWKDLTDNVNQLAANLTNQVRAIAEVATAVTEGDLTRQVGSEASGEVAGPQGQAQRDDPQPAGDDRRTSSRTGSRPTVSASPGCCRASATSTPWQR